MKIYSGDFGRDDVHQRPESIVQLDGWRRTSEVSEPGGCGVLPNNLEIRRAVGGGSPRSLWSADAIRRSHESLRWATSSSRSKSLPEEA